MLDTIKYVNSQGAELLFGARGLYVNANDLRDWEWSYETTHGRVSNFSRKPITRSLPVKVWAESDTQGHALKNQLHDVAHVDIIAGKPGRLYVGDCYMECYLIASSKSDYLRSARATDIALTVAADKAIWYLDSETWFGQRAGLTSAAVGAAIVGYALVGSDGSDSESVSAVSYPHDYPYGYSSGLTTSDDLITNNFVAPCDWKIVIKGAAVNPAIDIGGDTHQLNYTSGEGEVIEIDSRSRTIKVISATGEEINIFRYRDKNADIFAKIRPGSHTVAWNGDYLFGITLYGERSEPLWT